jgi:hypothetical protein
MCSSENSLCAVSVVVAIPTPGASARLFLLDADVGDAAAFGTLRWSSVVRQVSTVSLLQGYIMVKTFVTADSVSWSQ